MEQKKHPLLKKALWLEYATIFWNVLEGVSCVTVGLLSGSVSLLAYGLESSVEVFASGLVIWDLKGTSKKRQEKALKLIGLAYLVVSAYIFLDAIKAILAHARPDHSLLGVILLAVTACEMGVLGILKFRVGKQMKSPTLLADAKFTMIDGMLAITVLIGLLTNALFGWWWMDQALALFLSGVAFREGLRELTD